jgi:outer membrane lipoprotein carrier protein
MQINAAKRRGSLTVMMNFWPIQAVRPSQMRAFICVYLRTSAARFFAVFAALLPLASAAQSPNAIDSFRAFVQTTQTGRAEFTQVMTDNRGKVGAASTGVLQFQRPGKFRWVYQKPAQVIVGDGKKVWFFDQDLNQVTVRKLEAAFSSTPAALLAGRAEIDAAFTLVAAGESESMNWLAAEPKQRDAGIEKIRIGFTGTELKVMELFDAFGNKTRITLSKLERNPRIDAAQFGFVPPKGADVVGE